METTPILIRVDGGDIIGYGHLMRSKALADGFLEKGYNVHFYSRIIDGSAERILTSTKFTHHQIPADIEETDEAEWVLSDYYKKYQVHPQLVIVDGYHIQSSDWQIYSAHSKLLVTDAFGGKNYNSADIIYNAYTDVKELNYSTVKSSSSLLAGPLYALIRNEITKAKCSRPKIESVKAILINGGGVDEHNVAGNVAKGLKHVPVKLWPEKAFFIVGKEYPFSDDLKLNLFDLPFAEILVEPNDWVDILRSVDLAIIAGGSTQYEATYLGTPYVSFIVEENQLGLTRTMSELGITLYVGWLKEKNPAEIGRIYESIVADTNGLNLRAEKGQDLIDGKGVQRVIERCLKLIRH